MRLYITLLLSLCTASVSAQSLITAQRTNRDVELMIPGQDLHAETIFSMRNINGDLNVEGYDGNDILITGNKIISAEARAKDDFEPSEFYLDTLRGSRTLFVFIRQPDAEVHVEGDRLIYRSRYRNTKKNTGRYFFEFNLVIKVPHKLISEFSTINKGNVVVDGMHNGVKANNINGNVFLTDVNGAVSAKTVNGNIRVDYAAQPESDAAFHTVNGTIEVLAPKDLSAIVTFKSFQGELYTDFSDLSYLPKRVKQNKDGMTRYSTSQSAPIQIGEGGPEMHFQLLNGNAYLKQRQSQN